jgi:intermembrane space import and assembly protein 40
LVSSSARNSIINFVIIAYKPVSVPPATSSEIPTDTPSSTKTTPSHKPESIAKLTTDKSGGDQPSEGGDPSEGAAPSEDDESSGGAFNPVTGEINWDCPCLGGMAHGPCGPQFREAFSCFVFSEKEPKGIDCVEKFKGMQDCFKEHPDIYGEGVYGNVLWMGMNGC